MVRPPFVLTNGVTGAALHLLGTGPVGYHPRRGATILAAVPVAASSDRAERSGPHGPSMTQGASELVLFREVGSGNPAAFAELASRIGRCVHWVLLHRIGGGHALLGEADEIVDETMLRLEGLRARGFSGSDPEFRGYLYQVVASVAIDTARRRRGLESLDEPLDPADPDSRTLGHVVSALVDPALAPEAGERAEADLRVSQALETLDPRCRTLLRRFHLEETPVKQIADGEGARPNAIEVALTRCRQKLYARFLAAYVGDDDPQFRQRVAAAGRTLPAPLDHVFGAWWTENRSPGDIAKERGWPAADARRLLADAKRAVWERLTEAGAP